MIAKSSRNTLNAPSSIGVGFLEKVIYTPIYFIARKFRGRGQKTAKLKCREKRILRPTAKLKCLENSLFRQHTNFLKIGLLGEYSADNFRFSPTTAKFAIMLLPRKQLTWDDNDPSRPFDLS